MGTLLPASSAASIAIAMASSLVKIFCVDLIVPDCSRWLKSANSTCTQRRMSKAEVALHFVSSPNALAMLLQLPRGRTQQDRDRGFAFTRQWKTHRLDRPLHRLHQLRAGSATLLLPTVL
jgi:hypothetical protein